MRVDQMLSTDETVPSESRPPAAGDWRRSLTRAAARGTRRLAPPECVDAGKPLILLAIWLACAAIAVTVDEIFVRVLCWIVIGGVLHCFGAFVHDCSHLSVFRKPWLDRSLGFLCGLPVFFPSASYRATHQLHHKYLNTAKDPGCTRGQFSRPAPACRDLLWLARRRHAGLHRDPHRHRAVSRAPRHPTSSPA